MEIIFYHGKIRSYSYCDNSRNYFYHDRGGAGCACQMGAGDPYARAGGAGAWSFPKVVGEER